MLLRKSHASVAAADGLVTQSQGDSGDHGLHDQAESSQS